MAIERKKIIAEAIALLDEVGIDNLTTRRLADRLGVKQPALYWHFKNKRELLDAMNEAMMLEGHTFRMPTPGETWQDFVKKNARSFRSALMAHRDGARVHAGTHPGPSDLEGANAQLHLYLDAGFDEETTMFIGIAISRYVLGSVLEEQAEEEEQDSRDLIREFEAFPLLHAFARRLAENDGGAMDERVFELGLDVIVRGLESILAERRTGNTEPSK